MSSPGRQLKELHRAPQILIAPGIYDGYSARLIEQLGFRSASISGAGTSESRMGWADRGVMGLEDTLASARGPPRCRGLRRRGDADTGYGNAINVYFVTRAFEK